MSGMESESEMRKWRQWHIYIIFQNFVWERKQKEREWGAGGSCGVKRPLVFGFYLNLNPDT